MLSLEEMGSLVRQLPPGEWRREYAENEWGQHAGDVSVRIRLYEERERLFARTKTKKGRIRVTSWLGHEYRVLGEYDGPEAVPIIQDVNARRKEFYRNQTIEQLSKYLPQERVRELVRANGGSA
jgi:hypothetical protein